MKNRGIKDNVLIGSILLFVLAVMFGYIAPDKEFSSAERRRLATMPRLSVKNLVSGEYMTDMEDYLVDHMAGRDMMRNIYLLASQRVFGKIEVNGYIQKENAVYKMEDTLSSDYVKKNTRYFANIQKQYFAKNPVYYAIIPDKNYYLEEPCGYLRFDYEAERDILKEELNGQYIDIWDCLKLEDYYRTDLHWKQQNLDRVVNRILFTMCEDEESSESVQASYQLKLASTDFRGGYLTASGYAVQPDTLYYLQPDHLSDITVYDYEKQQSMPLYTLDRIGGGDDYDIFLGGAKALLTIENTHAKTSKELIIFRDSYTSSLAPLLIESYCKITLVDLRYITPEYAISLIDWNDDTQILFLYQAMTLNANAFRQK